MFKVALVLAVALIIAAVQAQTIPQYVSSTKLAGPFASSAGLTNKGRFLAYAANPNQVTVVSLASGTVISVANVTGATAVSAPFVDPANNLVFVFATISSAVYLNTYSFLAPSAVQVASTNLSPLPVLPECAAFDSVSRQVIVNFATLPAVVFNLNTQTNSTLTSLVGGGNSQGASCVVDQTNQIAHFAVQSSMQIRSFNMKNTPPTLMATYNIGGSAQQIDISYDGVSSVFGSLYTAGAAGSGLQVNTTLNATKTVALPASSGKPYAFMVDPVYQLAYYGGFNGLNLFVPNTAFNNGTTVSSGVTATAGQTFTGVGLVDYGNGLGVASAYILDNSYNLYKLTSNQTPQPTPTPGTATTTTSPGTTTTGATTTTALPTPTSTKSISGVSTVKASLLLGATVMIALML